MLNQVTNPVMGVHQLRVLSSKNLALYTTSLWYHSARTSNDNPLFSTSSCFTQAQSQQECTSSRAPDAEQTCNLSTSSGKYSSSGSTNSRVEYLHTTGANARSTPSSDQRHHYHFTASYNSASKHVQSLASTWDDNMHGQGLGCSAYKCHHHHTST